MSHRFAIIGCGSIASRHAEQINHTGELVAVCDIDHPRADAFAEQYRVKRYYELSDLLAAETPGIVVVCTPNGLHPAHSIQALNAGCHVLCEKPLSVTSESGRQMIHAAKRAGRRLFVVKQNRFNAPVVAVKKLLDEGKLGRVHSFQINCFWNRPAAYYENSWRGTKLLDGGTLFTQFSHFIDLLYWFLGGIESVSGCRGNFLHGDSIEFEDTGAATLTMKNGSIGTLSYTINSYSSNLEGSFTLLGERGSVKIGGQYLNRLDYFSVQNEEPPGHFPITGANDYGIYQGSMSNHDMIYKELIKALNDPGYPFLDASEALESVEMIEQIYAASPLIQIPAK